MNSIKQPMWIDLRTDQ